MLQRAWMESDSFNELCLMPTIICEGEWKNEPQETREFLLNLLDVIDAAYRASRREEA